MTDYISVIVPVFNAEKYLMDCINALFAQNYPDEKFQIIMVDNNSTDSSRDIIKQFPRIHLELEKQQGAYSARNRGIRRAEGNILAFTDPDCIPDVNWLKNITAVLQDQNIRIVLGKNLFAGKSKALLMLQEYEAEKAAFVFSGTEPLSYYGYTNNMAVRSDIFDHIGSFVRISRGADVALMRRAVDVFSCESVRYAPDIQVKHSEITSIKAYYRKQYIYGKSFKNYSKLYIARSLNTSERMQVFKMARRNNNYTFTDSIRFLILLLWGAAYYEIGRI